MIDRNTKIWGKYENLVRFQRSSKGPDRKKKENTFETHLRPIGNRGG